MKHMTTDVKTTISYVKVTPRSTIMAAFEWPDQTSYRCPNCPIDTRYLERDISDIRKRKRNGKFHFRHPTILLQVYSFRTQTGCGNMVKIGTLIDISDIITRANFRGNWFRVVSQGSNSPFYISQRSS